MSLIDFILNLAGLLLWLNWRAAEPIMVAPAVNTSGALPQRVRPPRSRWWYFVGLILLLAGRALFYWQAAGALHWQPGIHFSSYWLAFRTDFPGRMMLYSFFSFAATVGFFYLCLLLISSVNGPAAETDGTQRFVRLHLGRLDRWPGPVKLLLPLVAMTVFWCSFNPLLLQIDMVPKVSLGQLLTQGALIGLAGYLTLKFLVVGFLAVYVLNSHIYLGESSFLKFVNTTATALLRPLRWLPLRIGRVDLAPLVGVALVVVVAEFGRRGLDRLYH